MDLTIRCVDILLKYAHF